jgi:ABC-2 type transport system ATP-binding protein
MDEADGACDRVALMNRGRIVATGSPTELKAALGLDATLDDVFRHHTGAIVDEGGDVRDVASVRRTANRLG